jgi:hypothetical protein
MKKQEKRVQEPFQIPILAKNAQEDKNNVDLWLSLLRIS